LFHPIENIEDAQTLAQAIVNTIVEPFLVLDEQFHVLAASRSFYQTFKVDPEQTHGALLYALGDGQWDIPALRLLLETIIPEKTAMDGFEVSHDFPTIGHRTMLLNARKVLYDHSSAITILLAFNDITARRSIEKEKEELLARTEELLRQKDVLLREMEHRVANSLQIIASVLMQSARRVQSDETRTHLYSAHNRVMSIATLQKQLAVTSNNEVELRPYLKDLCASIGASMIDDVGHITLISTADDSKATANVSVSLGLIVTELVINALKHAFPEPDQSGAVTVDYSAQGEGWELNVEDDGVGIVAGDGQGTPGLGTGIVDALAKQLGASVTTSDKGPGTKVSVVHP
jgi:two-component sensor histidine kinase